MSRTSLTAVPVLCKTAVEREREYRQSDDATGIHLYDLRSYGNWHPHTQVPAFWKMQPEPASRETVQLAVQGAVLGRLSNEHGGAGTFLELGNWRTGQTCAVSPGPSLECG